MRFTPKMVALGRFPTSTRCWNLSAGTVNL